MPVGKVKSVLKHRLLDFPLEKQALVWPFLLPEVAFWLNSSWNSSTNITAFEAFFGRKCNQFSNKKDGSQLLVLPSDKYLMWILLYK